jgi:hypothetical protein
VRVLAYPAKTQYELVISDKQRTHFGQKHAFGGFRSCLLGVFREFEFGDRTMKNGETLGGIRLCGHLMSLVGTRKQGTVHKAMVKVMCLWLVPCCTGIRRIAPAGCRRS